jgi:phage/plasmid-like protein (TIGR03299 family)
MSANISVQNGRAEMFSGNNVVPWHKLGNVVAGLLKAADAIVAAHLDWHVAGMKVNVNGQELKFPTADDSTDCYQGICRTDTGACLGIVKGRYTTIQNKDCFDFLDTLVSGGNIQYETAGALRGGRVVWMLAKYDGEIEINGDKHQQWLLCVNSHDGSTPLMIQWVTVRVVCANTLSIALKSAKNQCRIRHLKNWEDKANEAQRILGLTKEYFAEARKALAGLNQQPMTAEDMQAFTRLMFPAKDEKDVPTKTSNMRFGVERLFNRPEVGTNGASRWDALNAVTDYADHYSSLRGPNSTRLESSLLGTAGDLKQRAFEYLTNDDLMAQLLAKSYTPAGTSAVGSQDFARLLNQN